MHPPLAFNKANATLLMSAKVYGLMPEGFYGNEVNRNSRVCLSMTHCLLCFFFFFLEGTFLCLCFSQSLNTCNDLTSVK